MFFKSHILDIVSNVRKDKNFDARKLVYFVHHLRSKANLKDSDFEILPSYDGFRDKVKKLLS